MKKVILSPYFGEFPNHFPLFIDSCGRNEDFDFLIVTDQIIHNTMPSNVRVVNLTFLGMNRLIRKKLGKKYDISAPYKLCDYRPAYGKIFEDYIINYDFWGYCDMDLVFGRISSFVPDSDFMIHDKLLINGHLTFYRNSSSVNEYYRLPTAKYINFERACSISEPCFFDEIGMPVVLGEHGIPQYRNWNFVDVLPQRLKMQAKVNNEIKNHVHQKFCYVRGKIFQEFSTDGKLQTNESMYIHLQKRAMAYNADEVDLEKKVYINPNIFSNYSDEVSGMNGIAYTAKYYYRLARKINFSRIKIKLQVLSMRAGKLGTKTINQIGG